MKAMVIYDSVFGNTEQVAREKRIPDDGPKGIKVAAFDTRISINGIKSSILGFLVKIGGYAAKPIADRLQKKGVTWLCRPKDSL